MLAQKSILYNHPFLYILRAGLWNYELFLSNFTSVDYVSIKRYAETQSVVGLITAGFEKIQDIKIPEAEIFQFIGSTLQIEQLNKGMNCFIEQLFRLLQENGIIAVLIKGQGIAQCYEKPLWRACGDVDLLLDAENYERAKDVLMPLASSIGMEDVKRLHLELKISEWIVELHGKFHSQLGAKVDQIIDEVQNDTFKSTQIRIWKNGETDIPLPIPDNDVIYVFTHVLRHFFGGGIGLRQICDLCRLLWTYRDNLDYRLLESRIRKMGLMSQWKSIAALAVGLLGMPVEAMPMYSADAKWKKKAERILKLIFESGNFGHGRNMDYKKKYPRVIEYLISFCIYTRYSLKQFTIFPKEAIRGWIRTIKQGIMSKLKDMSYVQVVEKDIYR